jgi:ParB family chromosome partitioning protein
MSATETVLPQGWFDESPAGEGAPGEESGTNAGDVARRLASSARLSKRRYEQLPLVGESAVFTEVQGRMPGESTSPEGLVELTNSIGAMGVLQPILVEEVGKSGYRLVSGERRLRACRLGLLEQPDNPHFQRVPALVCPGPLSEEERRAWQLVENLAREDLQPGELGYALVFERCALLASHLVRAGAPVSPEAFSIDDPVLRWEELTKAARSSKVAVIAPWEEVLRRLGLRQLKADTAKQIARALRTLPAELTEEFDKEKVPLSTRLEYITLRNGRAEAAAELWAAVRARGAPERLRGATREMIDHPALPAAQALERAEEKVESANRARSETLRRRAEMERGVTRGNLELEDGGRLEVVARSGSPSTPGPGVPVTRKPVKESPATDPNRDENDEPDEDLLVGPTLAEPKLVKATLDALRKLLGELRSGAVLDRYDAGSLRLFSEELMQVLDDVSPEPGGGEG